MNNKELVLEQIALDGLDGCTINTLWVHLENCDLKMSLDTEAKEFLWSRLVQLRQVRSAQPI